MTDFVKKPDGTTVGPNGIHLRPEADEEACAAWREHTKGIRRSEKPFLWTIHHMTTAGAGAIVPTYWPPGYRPGSLKMRGR